MRHIPYVLLVLAISAALQLNSAQDAVTQARALALAGQRADAIALLQGAVSAAPADTDARVLLGTVLSWEGRYDEARHELEIILAESPTHGDALPAMINVELWSDHSVRAEELASGALRNRPNDTGMLLARARALSALTRHGEARETLDRLLVIDPRNEPALQMRRGLEGSLRHWQVRAGTSYDTFSDDRAAWRESQASLGRATPIGALIIRGSRAQRFELADNQIEVEMYPRLRPGTYAYVAVALSPDAVLFPAYRYAADVYQSLGAGFEGSAGFRRLGFGDGVNLYTGSLSKYYGNWLFTGRLFVTPNSAGASRSIHGSFRRYIGGSGTYVGLRYGRGAWREELRSLNDFEVLDSDVAAAEATFIVGGRLELNVSGSYSREDRVERRGLKQFSLSTGLGFRF